MNQKNNQLISFRRDLFTYKKYEKKELYKFCFKNNSFIFDKEQKLKGRGFYLNKENYTISNLFKVRQKICRAYKCTISNEVFNNFTELVKESFNIKDE